MSQSVLLGYKLVGDNKGVKAKYMRAEKHHGQSLYYFHFCALRNRIDFSDYLDVSPATCLDSPKRRALYLLPSKEDDCALHTDFAILVSRILVDNMAYFCHTFDGVITWHIKHEHYSEMCQKSVVVSVVSFS